MWTSLCKNEFITTRSTLLVGTLLLLQSWPCWERGHGGSSPATALQPDAAALATGPTFEAGEGAARHPEACSRGGAAVVEAGGPFCRGRRRSFIQLAFDHTPEETAAAAAFAAEAEATGPAVRVAPNLVALGLSADARRGLGPQISEERIDVAKDRFHFGNHTEVDRIALTSKVAPGNLDASRGASLPQLVATAASAMHPKVLQLLQGSSEPVLGRSPVLALTVIAIAICIVCFLGAAGAMLSKGNGGSEDDGEDDRPSSRRQGQEYRRKACGGSGTAGGDDKGGGGTTSPAKSPTPRASNTPSPRASGRPPLPPSPTAPSNLPTARHLCPGLVVPRGNECILAVPANPVASGVGSVEIREMSGAAMIRAELSPPQWTGAGAAKSETPTLMLRSVHGPAPLIAYCRAISEPGGRRSAYVYDTHGEIFAHITKVAATSGAATQRPSYAFTSARSGLQLIFTGNFGEHAVNVTDEKRKMVADTEPCRVKFDESGAYYRLRVTERVDVGLILCALLSIDQMEATTPG